MANLYWDATVQYLQYGVCCSPLLNPEEDVYTIMTVLEFGLIRVGLLLIRATCVQYKYGNSKEKAAMQPIRNVSDCEVILR